MFLHSLCYLGCNSLNNQDSNWFYFVYSDWYLKKDITLIKFGARTQWNCAQTTI